VSILPNDYSKLAWEASTLPLSYTRTDAAEIPTTQLLNECSIYRPVGTTFHRIMLFPLLSTTSGSIPGIHRTEGRWLNPLTL